MAERRTGTGQKVLVVEDDLDNRWVTVRMLAGAGYTPLEAGDGYEAIEVAQRERPALILMDLALPRLDGFEATRRLKADPTLRSIPVLALTALAMNVDEQRARAAGVDEYVTKPVRSAKIRAMVRRYLGGVMIPAMTGTVLIVDDNPDSIMVLRSILESNGFAVLSAGNGHEALQAMEKQVPDAVLLDVMMPDLSGIDVLKRLRSAAATARVPVILVTAKGQDEDLLDGYQHGADYYITKPCTAKQLLYGLSMVLGKPSTELPSEEPEDLV